MLAYFRVPEAFDFFVQMLEWDPLSYETTFVDDNYHQQFDVFLSSTYTGDFDAIKDIIENEDLHILARVAALRCVRNLCIHDIVSREKVISYYKCLAQSLLVENRDFASFLVMYAASLCPQEMYDEIMALFERKLIDAEIASFSEVKYACGCSYEQCVPIVKRESTCSIHYATKNEVIEKLIMVYHNISQVQIIRTEPKIGRNDPCPCQSGKKYKKCCLNKS